MSLLNKNILELYKDIFSKLPESSFTLSLKPDNPLSNILFVSELSTEEFLNVSISLLTENHIECVISEDALLFNFENDHLEISYLPIDIYEARIKPHNLFLHQNRSTSWSIGPWLIECFWSNILSSTLFFGKRDLESDKQSIRDHCTKILSSFLDKEISNKRKLLEKTNTDLLIKNLLLMDLRIAMIRKFFISKNILLCGLNKINSVEASLTQEERKALEVLRAVDNLEFLSLVTF